MTSPPTSIRRSHRLARGLVLVASIALLLTGIWAVSGPEAQGSNVLIVIEDASPQPTGMFPGTVCYQVVRLSDDVTVTEGCLAFAASLAAPAGFDHAVLYTLVVSVNDSRCTLLPDQRIGTGVMPFRVRVSCDVLERTRSDGVDTDSDYAAAGASPIAIPDRTSP